MGLDVHVSQQRSHEVSGKKASNLSEVDGIIQSRMDYFPGLTTVEM